MVVRLPMDIAPTLASRIPALGVTFNSLTVTGGVYPEVAATDPTSIAPKSRALAGVEIKVLAANDAAMQRHSSRRYFSRGSMFLVSMKNRHNSLMCHTKFGLCLPHF